MSSEGENIKKETESGGAESGKRGGEEQKGKLVHAMIMVVNHRSQHILQRKKKKT